ncbi:lysylphosphatidylglycerol synthase transmembrane domain-containing protein [Prolixibacter sp. NT017]|uniref:lysylphosphatidylglycerol synthase transmembrane domain-containing protein n=1 Tax=Prolixibacter sp. NT017 TaxID=2652390 RepID=UPI00127E4EBD|nr:lysylphosphatidylglycerol synthase transmembrane domain-containing protein [Prolixibacter sp. NT017]GET26974.1 hypothetical protein NT017_33030 [Prolixibacter sp. NT017]
MRKDQHKILKEVHPSRVIIPLIISVAVGIYIVAVEETPPSLSDLHFNRQMLGWLLAVLAMVLMRDIGYIIRLRILSDKQLSIIQSIRITFLWEFASAVTPSAIGGTSVALLFLYKEGLSIGKGSAIVLATFFLDELYFILMFPLVIWLGGWQQLFETTPGDPSSIFHNQFFWFAIAGYGVKLTIISLVSYGLFINPRAIKKLIAVVFRLPFLKRWQQDAMDSGDEIAMASKELTAKPFSFWVKSFTATFFSWTSRYWVANFLFLALFFGLKGQLNQDIVSIGEQIHIFARQLIMWIMMMVMPTPGGTGFSEVVFLQYMDVFIPQGFASLMTIIWRFVSYYPYLFIGAVILPGWIRRSFKRRHAPKKAEA